MLGLTQNNFNSNLNVKLPETVAREGIQGNSSGLLLQIKENNSQNKNWRFLKSQNNKDKEDHYFLWVAYANLTASKFLQSSGNFPLELRGNSIWNPQILASIWPQNSTGNSTALIKSLALPSYQDTFVWKFCYNSRSPGYVLLQKGFYICWNGELCTQLHVVRYFHSCQNSITRWVKGGLFIVKEKTTWKDGMNLCLQPASCPLLTEVKRMNSSLESIYPKLDLVASCTVCTLVPH